MSVTFLTNEDKTIIDQNISQLSKEMVSSVRTTAQTLTETEKAQARLNIGAASDVLEILEERQFFDTYVLDNNLTLNSGIIEYTPSTDRTATLLMKQSTLMGGRVYFEFDPNKIVGFGLRGFLFDENNTLVGLFCNNNGNGFNPAFNGNVIGDYDVNAWLPVVSDQCTRIYEVTGNISIAVPEGHTTRFEIFIVYSCTYPDGTVTNKLTSESLENGTYVYVWAKTGFVITTKVEKKINENTLQFISQNLTEKQKAQARANIGAVSISEVVDTVENSYKTVPVYWQSAVNDTIEAVKTKQNEGGHNCITFAFFSDSHIGASGTGDAGHTGILCKAVMDACDIPYAIACGDNTDEMGDGSKESISSVRTAFVRTRDNFAPIGWDRLLQTIGNHDGCWGHNESLDDVYYCYQLNSNEIYNQVYRKHKGVSGIVFGGDCSYYYVDDVSSKTRFVVLNSHWVLDSYTDDVAINRRMRTFGFGQDQLSWFADKALTFDEDDWGVVIAFHAPLNVSGVYRDRDVLIGILESYIAGTSGNYTYGTHGTWDAVNVTVDYASKAHRAEIIGVFNGHEHEDIIDTETYSFPTVRIICDSGMSAQNSSYIGERKFGTDTEHAIDFVTINRTTKNVSLTRLGAGYERNREYYFG